MTNYHNGRKREYQVIKDLEAQGFTCARSAGSHTEVDVWAINEKTKVVYLIQVKPGNMLNKDGSLGKQAREISDKLKRFEGEYMVFTKVAIKKKYSRQDLLNRDDRIQNG